MNAMSSANAMRASARLPCEFFLIRYVPDVVKGEFVNIGVVLREAAGSGSDSEAQAARVRFTRDWARVRCIDADADIAVLEGLEQEIGARLIEPPATAAQPKPVMALLEDTLSNSLQVTEARACLAENMTTEMEQLMRMYVEPLKLVKTRVKTGRAAINGAIRLEFERAGVWGLMRKRIATSTYTQPGDPMKIDCGYRAGITSGDIVRMFHAVSLDSDVEAAKVLAYSAPQLREGVARVEAAALELTAVVEPLRMVSEVEDEAQERYRFGVDAMERQAIRVVTINDLARAAETARRDLRI